MVLIRDHVEVRITGQFFKVGGKKCELVNVLWCVEYSVNYTLLLLSIFSLPYDSAYFLSGEEWF